MINKKVLKKDVETKIVLNHIEYAFIIHDNEPYFRRLDGMQPNENEMITLHKYIEDEGWIETPNEMI
jgi:hypothetical protein